MVLSADAGDEIFAGYSKHNGLLGIVNQIRKVPAVLRKPVAAMLRNTPAAVLKKGAGLSEPVKKIQKKVPGILNTILMRLK